MSLAQKLCGREWCHTDDINCVFFDHNVEEITQFIRSSEDFQHFCIDRPPVIEEFGRHASDAIVQSPHIRELRFENGSCDIRVLVAAWIGSRNTLVNMTSLESVRVDAEYDHMSVFDCFTLFPLLLTSPSLRKFEIHFVHTECPDDVMGALLWFIATASLRAFEFHPRILSEDAFTDLCNAVALSSVRQITLGKRTLQNVDLETGAAESLAWMIVESSLEDVTIQGVLSTWSESLISALKRTAPVRNMDFAFTQIGDDTYEAHLMINRKWKPLVFSANTPLALWPQILEKSHASPETSHGSADILFYVLRQKPDLVPAP